MLWGMDASGYCRPEVHGGPSEQILQINVRADAIVYVAELPRLPIIERIPASRQSALDRLKEAAERMITTEPKEAE